MNNDAGHFVSRSCGGERCSVCRADATHKLGEEIMHDDPSPHRHNLTAYVCCEHFRMIVGSCGFANLPGFLVSSETGESESHSHATLSIFEHLPSEPYDGLSVSDEYIAPESHGYQLRFATAYEADVMNRDDVARLHDAIGRWLALRTRS
jgi:hypothetical protein